MTNQSVMVWVTKYKLKKHVQYSNKTPKDELIRMWNDPGMFEEHRSSLQKRSWIMERNSQTNNEYFKIDEEETARLMKIREGNLVNNAKRKKDETVSMSDLVTVLGGLANNSQPKEAPKKVVKAIKEPTTTDDSVEAKTVEELRAICDEKGIEYHHAAKEAKLLELIKG